MYKYKLECIDDENNITTVHQFPGTVTADEMRDFLKDFLLGCSWNESTVKKILNIEE